MFFIIADNGIIATKDIVDIGMVDMGYLKLFNAHYGEKSKLGDLLYDAQ